MKKLLWWYTSDCKTQTRSWEASPSMCEDSGLLVVLMLLLEPSLISDPVTEAGLPMELDFLLGSDGAAGSVREPLLVIGALRSGFGFSFSAEEWEERNKY